jgi:hypothetical protein
MGPAGNGRAPREKLFVGPPLANDFQIAQAVCASVAPDYRLLNVTGFFLAADGVFFSGMVSSMMIFFTP